MEECKKYIIEPNFNAIRYFLKCIGIINIDNKSLTNLWMKIWLTNVTIKMNAKTIKMFSMIIQFINEET